MCIKWGKNDKDTEKVNKRIKWRGALRLRKLRSVRRGRKLRSALRIGHWIDVPRWSDILFFNFSAQRHQNFKFLIYPLEHIRAERSLALTYLLWN